MVETLLCRKEQPMAVFLLAVISRGGLDSLYALRQEAGLQPGNLLPLIRPLIADGMLTRSEQGRRRRKTIAITESGERFLVENWKRGLDIHRDMETVLRSATVALLMDDVREAIRCLQAFSSEREARSRAQALYSLSPITGAIPLHAAMKAVYQQRRDSLDADVSNDFIQFVAEHGLRSQLQTGGGSGSKPGPRGN